jgi:putative membrane protein
MKDGFLGYRTSFMLDFVVVALVLIVPVLIYSLYAVKIRHQYKLHRNLQLLLGIVLLPSEPPRSPPINSASCARSCEST